MVIRLNEDYNLDIDDMSKSELISYIKELLDKAKSKAIELDLDKNIFNSEGKDTYYEINDKVYDALHNHWTIDKWYVFIITNQIVFIKTTNRNTIKIFFANSGYMWSISKNGKTNMDRAWDKTDALKQLAYIAAECIDN